MKHVRIPSALAIALGALIAVSAACDDDDPIGPGDDVATVELTADSETIEIGSTAQLDLDIRDQSGNVIDPDDVTIQFTTSSATVATVSNTGVVTPVGVGSAVITANVEGVTDTITINVIAEISSIDVVDTELDLVTDETTTLNITVLNAAGNPVVDPSLDFTSSNASIVSVDEDGVLTAEGAGTATITVAGGGESDTIEITVFAATSGGLSVGGNAFTAVDDEDIAIGSMVVVRDAGGVIIPDAELAFASTNAGVATVDATGLLSPLSPGTTLVTVTSPDATGSATFRITVVESGGLDNFVIDPATGTIAVAGTTDLDVLAELDGDPIDDLLAVFSSSDATVATVDPLTGVVTGVAAGTATITATIGDFEAEAVITVQ
ncbi:MAG TPA: Ig-like domain-containing protein [Gemmatimonadota bacterium]|nr:Ig-like domain-containing protein [Gemmatimonadota bacterium]